MKAETRVEGENDIYVISVKVVQPISNQNQKKPIIMTILKY